MASTLSELKLGKKARHFIKRTLKMVKAGLTKVIVLEGTTQASKTTDVGILVPLLVMNSKQKYHIIAGRDVSSIEKNYINDDKVGILALYDNIKYYGRGDKDEKRPHLKVYMPDGTYKIIRILAFKNTDAWEYFRNGTYGVVVLDEANLCEQRALTEAMLRGTDVRILTLNPDSPDHPVYNTVNHCRPLKRYEEEYPEQLINELNLEHYEGWEHWYFTFEDNASLSQERIEEIKRSEEPGTRRYLSLILGLRQKPDGVCYPSFSRKNIYTEKQIYDYLQKEKDRFIQFSAALDTSFSGNTYDTNAMTFIGITQKHKLFILEERIISNKKLQEEGKSLYGPSDICLAFDNFCTTCCAKWHGSLNEIYVDAADSATYTQWYTTFESNPSKYVLLKSFKSRLAVNDRIVMVDGWMKDLDYIINEKCTEHIAECTKYMWDEKLTEKGKKKPVDKDNHTIDSVAYAWIPWATGPYRMIGNLKNMEIWT